MALKEQYRPPRPRRLGRAGPAATNTWGDSRSSWRRTAAAVARRTLSPYTSPQCGILFTFPKSSEPTMSTTMALRVLRTAGLLTLLLTACRAPAGEIKLARHPDYHDGKIVFSYLGDLWVVKEDGS